MKKNIKKIMNRLYNAASNDRAEMLASIYWGQIYNNTIIDSKWLVNKTVSPGRWAVGYDFLYVLYRALNDVKPETILELGLGQSTRLTSQYAAYKKAKHIVVEHDPEWKNFFELSWEQLSEYTEIQLHPLEKCEYGTNVYYKYKDFGMAIQDGKFNMILVDGPWGGDGNMSRRDILDYLPKSLAEDFILIFDDCGRLGEEKTVADVEKILSKAGIAYSKGAYFGGGYKHIVVITSASWKFLCSL